MNRLLAQLREAALVASLVVNIEPVSASRPRVTRFGTFYAKPYRTWIDQAKKEIPEGRLHFDKNKPLIAVIETVATKARTSKLYFPRGDVDNFAKGPLDVITKVGGYYDDDNQIVILLSSKRFAEPGEKAHTKVELYQ